MLVKFTNNGKVIFKEAALITGLTQRDNRTYIEGHGVYEGVDESMEDCAKRINAAKLLSMPMTLEQRTEMQNSTDIAAMAPYLLMGGVIFGSSMSS